MSTKEFIAIARTLRALRQTGMSPEQVEVFEQTVHGLMETMQQLNPRFNPVIFYNATR
jgi:hypothetical protein